MTLQEQFNLYTDTIKEVTFLNDKISKIQIADVSTSQYVVASVADQIISQFNNLEELKVERQGFNYQLDTIAHELRQSLAIVGTKVLVHNFNIKSDILLSLKDGAINLENI